MTPCHLLHIDKRFGELPVSTFDSEDRGGGYFRNASVRGRVSRKTIIAMVVAAINSKLASGEAKFVEDIWQIGTNVITSS